LSSFAVLEPKQCFCLFIESLLKTPFTLNQFCIYSLADIDFCFSQQLYQAASPRSLADLQCRSIVSSRWIQFVHSHQQIDVELVIVLNSGEVGGSQFLAGNACADQFHKLYSLFNLIASFCEVLQVSFGARSVVESKSFTIAVACSPSKWQGLVIIV